MKITAERWQSPRCHHEYHFGDIKERETSHALSGPNSLLLFPFFIGKQFLNVPYSIEFLLVLLFQLTGNLLHKEGKFLIYIKYRFMEYLTKKKNLIRMT